MFRFFVPFLSFSGHHKERALRTARRQRVDPQGLQGTARLPRGARPAEATKKLTAQRLGSDKRWDR